MPSIDYFWKGLSMSDRKPIKVLIVEDQETVRDTIRLGLRIIRKFKFEYKEASNGKEGLEALDSGFLPDLIIADLMMPEMDGFAFIDNVKSQDHLRFIPIIVLSAKSGVEDITHALRLGAIDYLVKPFEYRDLSRIERGIESGIILSRADRIRTLEEKIDEQSLQWEIINSLEVSRSFKIKDREDVIPLCSLLTQYFPNEKRNVLCMGLNEIILNGIVHGNLDVDSAIKDQVGGNQIFEQKVQEREKESPYNTRYVDVTLTRMKEQIKVVIEDEGKGFDPRTLKDPLSDPNCLLLPYGRGIAMTRFAFDEVEFSFPEDKGCCVTLLQGI